MVTQGKEQTTAYGKKQHARLRDPDRTARRGRGGGGEAAESSRTATRVFQASGQVRRAPFLAPGPGTLQPIILGSASDPTISFSSSWFLKRRTKRFLLSEL